MIKIKITNLSKEVGDQELKDLFNKFGKVSNSTVTIDQETGRSSGFGFITMKDKTEAQRAINEINRKEFLGKIEVVVYDPQQNLKIIIHLLNPR